jgi:hypothetical protein
LKKASKFLEEIMNNSLRQRRFIYHTLFTKWNEIIGDDISTLICPVRMRFSRRNDGAVLTVRINSALGAEMQLRAKNICERINQFYGREAVKKIKFETSSDLELLGNGKKKRTEKNEIVSKTTVGINFDQAKKFEIRTSDPELKAILESMQRNWFYRRQKYNKQT